MRPNTALFPLTVLLVSSGAAHATDYYVAPPNTSQSCNADGSQACPWIGISAAFGSQKLVGGDRLLLKDGSYGALNLWMVSFKSPVVVQSLNGKNARFDNILLNQGVSNITLRNLSVWPTDPRNPGVYSLVTSYIGSSFILVDGLDIRAGADAANYMSWSQSEWLARKVGALDLAGTNSIVQNSSALGTNGGFSTEGSDSAILNNRVEGFSGDALRAIGNNSTVSGNVAKNCFQVNEDHLDGFQSWAPTAGGSLSGLKIERNTIIEWTSPMSNPFRCELQGIGLFDGPYYNISITNNVVSVTAPHGITVAGGHNVQITNNTVVNNKGIEGQFPWVDVESQKDGTLPSNLLVANNLTMSLMYGPGLDSSILTSVNNSILIGLAKVFPNLAAFDYRPSAVSGFIDTGAVAYAPTTDILFAPRPFGAGPDRGAYEVGATAGSGSTSGGATTGDGSTTGGSTSDGSSTGTGDGSTTGGSVTDGSTSGTTTTLVGKVKWGAKFLKPPKK